MVNLWKKTPAEQSSSLIKSISPPPQLYRNAVADDQDGYVSDDQDLTTARDGDEQSLRSSLQHADVDPLRHDAQEWQDRSACFEAILETRTRECHELMEVCEQYEEEKELLVLNVSCQVNGACAMKFIGLKVTLRRLFWGFTEWRLALGEGRVVKAKRDISYANDERDAAVATERRESRRQP